MMKIHMMLLSAVFCCNVFAQDINNEGWNQNFPAEFIAKYGDALKYCRDIGRNRYRLDNKSLRILATLEMDQLGKFLIYKDELSTNRCIEDNGGYHVIFLISYMRNEKTTEINREIGNKFFDLIATSPMALDSVNFDKNMSDKKKRELKSINYLNTPFNVVKVADQINQARAKLPNTASPRAKKNP